MGESKIQLGEIQHGAIQHGAIQHGAIQHGAIQHGDESGMPETLMYSEGVLDVLDQLRLPRLISYEACRTCDEVAATIKGMKVRGAPAIGVAAAYGLVLAVLRHDPAHEGDLPTAFRAAGDRLFATRPTAVNLRWAIERMRTRFDGLVAGGTTTIDRLVGPLTEEAHQIRDEDVRQNKAMGHHGAGLVPEGARILTHCNAGSLATAGYGTAVGVIRRAHEEGKGIRVWVDETRPYLQGARLTAFEMSQLKIPYKLVADNMAGHLMSRGEVDLIVVGADRITARGHVANKIGTYSLAVLAQYHSIPFYVAAPLSTIDRTLEDGRDIPIEQRRPEELTRIGEIDLAPEGADTYNPAFDVTDPELVTGIITPHGVLRAPYDESIAGVFESVGESGSRKPEDG